jgi:AraC-like DNA-binding protein/tetratricopeptide (TPR) repeat protein
MTETLSKDQIFISKLTGIIHANLGNEDFGVKELARESGLSLYRLNQKLHSICRKTSNQFIREVRLQKALEMLQNETHTASEVAYKVGFGSPTYFTKSFHEFYGYPPGKVKKRDLNNPELSILMQNAAENRLKKSVWRTYILTLPGILLLALLSGTVVFLIYKKINKSAGTERLISSNSKIVIAVMPFQNMTNDTTWNVWQDWIQLSLISSLANTREVSVRQQESIRSLFQTRGLAEYVSISPAIARAVSKKLEADLFIYGFLQQAGTEIRLDAQVIDTRTEQVLQSFEINGPYKEEMLSELTDSLRKKVTNYLIISKLIRENYRRKHLFTLTNSPEALRYFIYGDRAYDKKEYSTARNLFLKALGADSSFHYAALMIEKTYSKEGITEQQFEWLLNNYEKRDRMPYAEQLYASWAYAFSFEPPEVGIKYLRQLEEIDDQVAEIPYLLGYTYNRMNQHENAIPELKRSLEIFCKWGREYFNDVGIYLELGNAYHETGQYRKEKKLYKMAEKNFPDEPWIIRFQAILAFTLKDSIAANRYIKKYISVLKKNSSSEGTVAGDLAWIYSMSGIPDKAEEYFRKSVELEPENTLILHNFANFLINKNRHLDEVPELMDRAMEIAPDKYHYYNFYDTKGWGLYKQGKYQEALDILQKTWDSAPFPIYSIYSHLEEVKKAVAENK